MPLYQKNPDVAGFELRTNAAGKAELVWLDDNGNGTPFLEMAMSGPNYIVALLPWPTGPLQVEANGKITVSG